MNGGGVTALLLVKPVERVRSQEEESTKACVVCVTEAKSEAFLQDLQLLLQYEFEGHLRRDVDAKLARCHGSRWRDAEACFFSQHAWKVSVPAEASGKFHCACHCCTRLNECLDERLPLMRTPLDRARLWLLK